MALREVNPIEEGFGKLSKERQPPIRDFGQKIKRAIQPSVLAKLGIEAIGETANGKLFVKLNPETGDLRGALSV
ncbi:hypothetical protein COX86_01045 [Candidatus Micrarchaeota archaeon CG_4_10_14_0_2_um_filter_60_11]|nr:MAG: hypothetical protein AUJ16_03420 [Candidatus Micrarchaeota archaeon CG1_02_60_51]PIN95784.1 MAG: hypothetical protein COU39_04095 [Candidatus Micrarchaeota archaeon CG10_big_fil_rev_8_21_14_0_10_60_32]PIO01777.1 MAG: hypothetical protein COT58_03385 [Candidatus Micrarchaeota archaeon CG09_land_8_20_14_0_10_60_16]PIY91201.1 MAG: hypothetical protein COY71_04465 [Candidatus Micrarchaeota archaeon CG_4_10_14_0_8_um_filter_60_7]PIZ91172.1 MAG: hypothetical protein COX86_01045 [Candidatus Mi